MTLLPAFLLGLIGSLHCLGMCGPLALALPALGSTRMSFVLGRIAYNFGRLLTYCLLGLVFGLIGKSLALAGIQRWVSIMLGALLLFGLFASNRRFRFPLLLGRRGPGRGGHMFPNLSPTLLVQRLKSGMGSLLQRRSFLSLTVLGLLNGLLPCGLVYVAAAGATASSGLLQGLTYMAAFGIGTLPMMLAISLGAKVAPFSLRLKLQRAIPFSVFLLALLLILRGMSLGVPYLSPDLAHGTCCH